MKPSRISRRDCLLLLGTGAGAVSTLEAADKPGEILHKSREMLQGSDPPTQPKILQQLDKLKAQRVYAETPVQTRREYSAARRGDGCQISLREEWDLLEADDALPPGQYSPRSSWVKVTMPTSIHYALMEVGKIPNLWYADNYKRLQWIQRRDWYLRRRFPVPRSWAGSRIRLRFDGMDYRGMVWLDGVFLGTHEGMSGGPTFDITSKVIPGKQHELLVRLLHEEHDLTISYTDAKHKGKPTVVKADAIDGESYVWGNRYRTIGLYQPIRLVATGEAFMEAPFVRTDSLAGTAARLWGQTMIANSGDAFEGLVDAQIVDLSNQRVVWQQKSRQMVTSGTSFWERRIDLDQPKLWWPNGMGAQSLYRLDLKLLGGSEQLDAIKTRFGVRTLELERNAVWPDAPRNFVCPGCRTHEDEAFRYLWVVNGRPFYAKGSCWMTADDVLALTPQREEWMIRAAKLNGVNLFRLNGGTSLFETEEFFDLCDENGIIVWQELPLNWVTTNTAPLEVWREQVRQTALRLRQHPSTGVYLGGNEYDAYGKGIEPLLGVAQEIFAGYDSQRPFRMASPCGGDYHAYSPWPSIWTADMNWYHKIYDRGHYFVSEWSFAAFANMSLLKRIVPGEELNVKPVGYDVDKFLDAHPILRDRCAETNFSSVKLWNPASRYGDLGKANISDLVEYSQMAHADNYGYVFEQWRAQFPYTGGQTVWTYNSMGPVAASWHYIDWFGQPQIAYYATKNANEPAHVMADTHFFSWGPGDTFRASVFALNDAQAVLRSVRISSRILDRNMRPVRVDSWALDLPGNGNKSENHLVHWPIPRGTPESYFFLELTLTNSEGEKLSRRIYWLRVLRMLGDPAARKKWQSAPAAEPLTRTGPWLKPQIEALSTSLAAHASVRQKSTIEAEIVVGVENRGSKPAYPVRLAVSPGTYSVVWSDNYFWLVSGEKVMITGTVRLDMTGLDPLSNPTLARPTDLTVEVSAWNAQPLRLRLL